MDNGSLLAGSCQLAATVYAPALTRVYVRLLPAGRTNLAHDGTDLAAYLARVLVEARCMFTAAALHKCSLAAMSIDWTAYSAPGPARRADWPGRWRARRRAGR